MTSPGDTSSSSSNPAHPTTATTRRRSDSPDYPASKKRRRTFTADDRAQHRVIEKQRREALNEKFIDLARLLPNLAHVRRLSKGLIVDASIAHHKRQRAQRLLASQEVRVLLEEREGLYKELDALRERLKEPPANAAPKRPDLRPETKQILAVEEEVCGTFPAGFGDNGPEDGQEDGENGDSDMRGSRSPEREVSGREVAAKESGKATMTAMEGSAGKEGNGSAGKEAEKDAGPASTEAVNIPRGREAGQSEREASRAMDDFAMDLSPSDIRILADDASRLLEHDATRMLEHDATRMLEEDATRLLEDDAARMLQDDPFMNPLAPSAALTDEDLLALLSADITLNLGDDRPSSIPQVYPDKVGNASSPHGLSNSPHSHNLSSSPHGLSSPPGFSSLSLSPPHHGPLSPSRHLTAPPDLSPSQIEDLWRQLGSVEIPDLGAGGGSGGGLAGLHPSGGPAGSEPRGGQRIPNRQGSGRGASTRAGQAGQHFANGYGFRDANGQHIPGLPATDDLFGLTANLSTTPVAGSMFGF
ncbi:uncharacterized protein SCHCODRAFT_02645939 [Schizophyllum commune H4-8]|uniref:uncharacterized protein n=1 Tax=Schizophyllum commune (strain H4-8 / FGSC 9210) TaxID=578458 RepID=UPI002160DE4F|nr:uncharacterized protein SCHCODRAFT_02645939 [Schizophyllum commune H4-8]KAI5884981.1 hypothetical protein SCHCODRAFT_02645939 [Schizophyllum commune H4-8]